MKLAVIGHPVSQSLSPLMQKHWLKQHGLNHTYDLCDVSGDALSSFLETIRQEDWLGFNVTIPHKESILPFLDRLAPQARRIGAVNTVLKKDGQLIGYNTDGLGFLKPLLERYEAVFHRPVLLIGAGGAARAILAALLTTHTPLVMVYNRTAEKAAGLVQSLGSGRATILRQDDVQDAVAAAGLIINATSCGMAGYDPLDIDLASASGDVVVYDIVYKPLNTPLLAQANSRGLQIIDGLDMLIHQGAQAFKIWTGRDADTVGVKDMLCSAIGEGCEVEP